MNEDEVKSSVSSGESAGLSDEAALLSTLAATGAIMSVKRVIRALNWDESRVRATIAALDRSGKISFCGSRGDFFTVAEGVDIHVFDTGSAKASAETESKKRLRTFEQPTDLDSLIRAIDSLPKLAATPEEIEAAKSACFERLVALVDRINAAIVRLAESSELVSVETSMVSIKRTDDGVYSYFYRYGGKKERQLFKYVWPRIVTKGWSDKTVADAERHCAWLLSEMMKFIKENG